MLPDSDLRRMQALPNVVLTGPRPYSRIPEYIRAFDICMTPHLVTPFTESLNPIKLWDYLAVGKPIISTPVAGFRDYPSLVSLASTADDFAKAVSDSANEDPDLPRRRREEAAKHSWDSRVEMVEQVIAHCESKTASGRESLPLNVADAVDRPAISAVIVSFNTRELTLKCLQTLRAELDGLSAEILVVDNGSTDESVEAVRESFPEVHVIENGRNTGFGAANNVAMLQSRGRYLLLLNSDAFPRPGAIRTLIAHLDQHPEVGIVGPRLLNEDGSLQPSCFRFPSPLQAWLENLWLSACFGHESALGDYRRWTHNSERRVEWIVGACMLLRREVFTEVGGFDERFFMYAEETDWQKRVRDAGWEVSFTPAAEVTHLGGASGASERARINRQFFESLDQYQRKHHGLAGLISLRCAMILGCGLRAALWAIAWFVRPRQRALAKSKARMHSWLFLRQATHWR